MAHQKPAGCDSNEGNYEKAKVNYQLDPDGTKRTSKFREIAFAK
jgi:hypothetical protein